jgi:uncharacterized protein YjbI with pentapeptide repeats
MANQEYLDILKQGVEAWNRWRKEHPDIQPDLSDANLSSVDLNRINFSSTNLRGANLTGAILAHSNLSYANLAYVNLSSAILRGADLSNAQTAATIFTNNDLSTVEGLTSVHHIEPSSIGIDTIYDAIPNLV